MIQKSSVQRVAGAFALLALSTFVPAHAAVLAEFTTGADNLNTNPTTIFGQSFTVNGSGSFTSVAFNFFSNHSPATAPSAAGTGFLLSNAYPGTPAALSSGTPGFLGSAIAAGGFYNFGTSVTLLGGSQYFFYSNGSTTVGGSGSGGYAGGITYISSGGVAFEPALNRNADANFRVTGDAVGSVPDSGFTAVILGGALAGLIAFRCRFA